MSAASQCRAKKQGATIKFNWRIRKWIPRRTTAVIKLCRHRLCTGLFNQKYTMLGYLCSCLIAQKNEEKVKLINVVGVSTG
jgi:Rieske Fe-S protein